MIAPFVQSCAFPENPSVRQSSTLSATDEAERTKLVHRVRSHRGMASHSPVAHEIYLSDGVFD